MTTISGRRSDCQSFLCCSMLHADGRIGSLSSTISEGYSSPAEEKRKDRAGAGANASDRESAGSRIYAWPQAGSSLEGHGRRIMKRTNVTYGQLDRVCVLASRIVW